MFLKAQKRKTHSVVDTRKKFVRSLRELSAVSINRKLVWFYL